MTLAVFGVRGASHRPPCWYSVMDQYPSALTTLILTRSGSSCRNAAPNLQEAAPGLSIVTTTPEDPRLVEGVRFVKLKKQPLFCVCVFISGIF